MATDEERQAARRAFARALSTLVETHDIGPVIIVSIRYAASDGRERDWQSRFTLPLEMPPLPME